MGRSSLRSRKRPHPPDGWTACIAQDSVATFEGQPSASQKPRSVRTPSSSFRPPLSSTCQTTTLFLQDVPSAFHSEHELRALIFQPVSSIRFATTNGRTIAWISLPSVQHARDALAHLHARYPSFAARPHVPKNTSSISPDPSKSSATQFDQRAQTVLSNGGVGNTLVFWNLPVHLTEQEFTSVLTADQSDINAPTLATPLPLPLRVRSALSKSSNSRTFWVVYASLNAARQAFTFSFGHKVIFRCGRCIKLHPVVHDDSTDVDETKRRQRARLLQPDARSSAPARPPQPQFDCACRALEAFLRSSQDSFAFLPHQANKAKTEPKCTTSSTPSQPTDVSDPLPVLP